MPEVAKPPRRRARSTRRVILDATQALLFELGADQLTIRRVEERSGFKAPTIYHHFRDKTGLIDALLEERCAELYARLCRVPRRGDPVAYLLALARAYLEFGLADPAQYALISAPRAESAELLPSAEAARRLVFRALVEACAARADATPDPEAVFQAVWAVLHGVVALRVSRPDHPWRPELVSLALETIERGIVAAERPR
ncbi:MAG TPA: TetR/AcrR family transcriptional regulator [Myxococcota bacterium]|nr:TetR/AcrR family transcriptional regulator [Myxococcota bacterium]